MRAFDAACGVRWAITEDGLRQVLSVAAREQADIEQARRLAEERRQTHALAVLPGRPLPQTHAVTLRDGVATVPIHGPIFRHANLLTELSGATSVEFLAHDLGRALADPTVRAIVLDVDSPGGQADGINELATLIRDGRAEKPITAYVGGQACSAAYWLASAAHEVVVDETAILGSIGAVMAVPRPEARSAAEVAFVSSQSPHKRPDMTTAEGQAQYQTLVDDLAAVFIGSVATNRGVDEATVLADFGRGGVLVGRKAVVAGLADRTGSFESVVAEHVSGVWGERPVPPSRPSAAKGSPMPETLWDQLKRSLSGEPTVQASSGQAPPPLTQESPMTEPTTDTLTPAGPLAGTLLRSDPDPEIERLRSELTRERTTHAEVQARLYADGLQRSGTILPAAHAAVVDAYRQAALDDQERPAATARVELVKALFDGRPDQTQPLTTEQVPSAELVALPPRATTPDPAAPAAMTEERRRELLGLSQLGRAALAQNGAK